MTLAYRNTVGLAAGYVNTDTFSADWIPARSSSWGRVARKRAWRTGRSPSALRPRPTARTSRSGPSPSSRSAAGITFGSGINATMIRRPSTGCSYRVPPTSSRCFTRGHSPSCKSEIEGSSPRWWAASAAAVATGAAAAVFVGARRGRLRGRFQILGKDRLGYGSGSLPAGRLVKGNALWKTSRSPLYQTTTGVEFDFPTRRSPGAASKNYRAAVPPTVSTWQ